jgi:hypothetical protein
MFDTLITIGIGLFFAYWIYVGGREWGKEKLWRSWEQRFAHQSLAALICGVIAFIYAFASGNNEEDSAPAYEPPLESRLKYFFIVFLFFFLPMLIGQLRGQKLAARVEALKSDSQNKE